MAVLPLALVEGPTEAIGVGARFEDVGTVGDAVEQRFAEAGVGDDLGPLGERQIGGQDHGRLLGPFGDHLEQELGADLGERDVADLVDGDQVVARPAGQDPAELELLLGLDQLVDQVGCRGEADLLLKVN